MLTVKSSQEFRDPGGLLSPSEDFSEPNFKRASSFKQKKPDHVRLNVNLVRRNSLPSPVSPKMFLLLPEERPLERVRSFHITRDGLKNRGDLLRRRSTISVNSCENCNYSGEALVSADNATPRVVRVVRVALVGCDEVGIHTLKNQLSTSEEVYINHHRGRCFWFLMWSVRRLIHCTWTLNVDPVWILLTSCHTRMFLWCWLKVRRIKGHHGDATICLHVYKLEANLSQIYPSFVKIFKILFDILNHIQILISIPISFT